MALITDLCKAIAIARHTCTYACIDIDVVHMRKINNELKLKLYINYNYNININYN
jgi:hypothetical protein